MRPPAAQRRFQRALDLARKAAGKDADIALHDVPEHAYRLLGGPPPLIANRAMLSVWMEEAPGRLAVTSRAAYCTMRQWDQPPTVLAAVENQVVVVALRPGKAASTLGGPANGKPMAVFDGRANANGGVIELLAADLPRSVRTGAVMAMTLRWKVVHPPGDAWKVFVHVDGMGTRARGDHLAALCGAEGWKPGDQIDDPFEVMASDHQGPLRPGAYAVYVGWYSGETRAVLVGPRTAPDQRLRLGTVTVEP